MLRNSIRKPQILPTEDPTMQYAFHNLIDIFQKLTAELYDWIAIECDESFGAAAMTQPNTLKLRDTQQHNHQQFCRRKSVIPIESVMGIQTLDVASTQQWLRVMLWNLSMSDLSQPTSIDALLPFHLPVLVGKTVMDVLQGSTALHRGPIDVILPSNHDISSIGANQMQEQRLFNNTDAILCKPSDLNAQEFLLDILNILSRIRRNNIQCYPALEQAQPQRFSVSSPSPPLSASSACNHFFQQ
jgi:hypothetical protein